MISTEIVIKNFGENFYRRGLITSLSCTKNGVVKVGLFDRTFFLNYKFKHTEVFRLTLAL